MGKHVKRSPVVDHREFMYMGIGWQLMDMRQDIEFESLFCGGYDWKLVTERLMTMQNTVGEYADKHFPYIEKGGGF